MFQYEMNSIRLGQFLLIFFYFNDRYLFLYELHSDRVIIQYKKLIFI